LDWQAVGILTSLSFLFFRSNSLGVFLEIDYHRTYICRVGGVAVVALRVLFRLVLARRRLAYAFESYLFSTVGCFGGSAGFYLDGIVGGGGDYCGAGGDSGAIGFEGEAAGV
jgi:hypothetical protein